eukprot:TRINITY_DN24015_c0_g1_i1.p2 TRINITY_DN24015_c0_g1~~TRINITY_DN24015_c0_g1_i1.p2  ORF type:complete len:122 (+),score=6.38 TRINITY_DN24015_c0_g1_i1:111-476(+)
MIRRPPRSTQGVSSAASDVYKRQCPYYLMRVKILLTIYPKQDLLLFRIQHRGKLIGSILQKMQGKQAENHTPASSNLQGVNSVCFPSQRRTDPQRGKKTVSQYQYRYSKPDAFDLCRSPHD